MARVEVSAMKGNRDTQRMSADSSAMKSCLSSGPDLRVVENRMNSQGVNCQATLKYELFFPAGNRGNRKRRLFSILDSALSSPLHLPLCLSILTPYRVEYEWQRGFLDCVRHGFKPSWISPFLLKML